MLILGVTFKENCPDHRNTKVVDLANELLKYLDEVDLHDPWVDSNLFEGQYNLKVFSELPNKAYDVIILAVSHDIFKDLDLKKLIKEKNTVVYDIKGFFQSKNVTERL